MKTPKWPLIQEIDGETIDPGLQGVILQSFFSWKEKGCKYQGFVTPSPYILVFNGPFTNLPFGICAIYFDLKVTAPAFQLLTSWWLNQPLLKNMLVELDHFPSAENKKYLKPPPNYCHH